MQNAIISMRNSLINANFTCTIYIQGKYVNSTVKLRVLVSYFLSENRYMLFSAFLYINLYGSYIAG
jgi:hypothetical protein